MSPPVYTGPPPVGPATQSIFDRREKQAEITKETGERERGRPMERGRPVLERGRLVLERGRPVRTGIAGILPARRASRPALTGARWLPKSQDNGNGGQDARRADGTSANPVRTRCPRSKTMSGGSKSPLRGSILAVHSQAPCLPLSQSPPLLVSLSRSLAWPQITA